MVMVLTLLFLDLLSQTGAVSSGVSALAQSQNPIPCITHFRNPPSTGLDLDI